MHMYMYMYIRLHTYIHTFIITRYKFAREKTYTVEPVLKDYLSGHKTMISQDSWSLVTGSINTEM